jgi:glycosyltransferase involved in cell wall biosynthesis
MKKYGVARPLVSIIIPCFNSEAYIGDAIESALAQTYPHKEVIVVDDGSTDASLSVIQSYCDRIRWESGPNRGACAARNRGIQLAAGSVLQFLDADDTLLPEKISRQIPLLLDNERASVFGWYEHWFANGTSPMAYRPSAPLLRDSVLLTLEHIVQIEAPLHWKTNVEKVMGFDESLPCNQDYDLNLRLACAGVEFLYDDHQTSRKLRLTQSVSSDACRRHSHMPNILDSAYRTLLAQGLLTEPRRLALAGRLALVARSLVSCGESALAGHAARLAFEIHPSGGVPRAYDRKSRAARAVFGPIWSEKLIALYQRLSGRKS